MSWIVRLVYAGEPDLLTLRASLYRLLGLVIIGVSLDARGGAIMVL